MRFLQQRFSSIRLVFTAVLDNTSRHGDVKNFLNRILGVSAMSNKTQPSRHGMLRYCLHYQKEI